MDLSDVVLRGTYRYDRTAVIAVALLPGEASEDDPTGPRDADMVMVTHLGDDHEFFVDPADLEEFDADRWVPGTELSADDQQRVRSRYVHRYTRDHVPEWVKLRGNGQAPPPVHFDSDQDWLARTRFRVTKKGRLDMRVKHCESSPTWPDGK